MPLWILPGVIAVSVLLVACSAAVPGPNQAGAQELSLVERAARLESKRACEAAGGRWEPLGKLQREACVLPAADAGKACSDKADCEVACVASRQVPAGASAQGRCHDSTYLFGCRAYVSGGIVEPTLCVD